MLKRVNQNTKDNAQENGKTNMPVARATKKRKNTYVVKLKDVMADLNAFELCEKTPLAVVTLNGKPVQNAGTWMQCNQFPNPGAAHMISAFPELHPIMGEKMASTIIEYLDKDTSEPVAMLFPTNEIMCRDDLPDFTQRMNHASRQDLYRQMKIRDRILRQIMESKQK